MERTIFETSRELEFFTERELTMQIGHRIERWPLAMVKELIDNALDACETAGTRPKISVSLTEEAITVSDNGPGLPEKTLRRSLDYTKRISDKTHYISPSRGQLGNALKCVWAAPFVANSGHGRVDVLTSGKRFRVTATVDQIEQRPRLSLDVTNGQNVKNGTTVRLHWDGVAGYLTPSGDPYFYNLTPLETLLADYAIFNPHLDLTYEPPEGAPRCWEPTAPGWSKWTPSDPTSAHWYTPEDFANLVAGYIAMERRGGKSLTVRQFVRTFDGLTSSCKQKAILDGLGLSRTSLSELATSDEVNRAATGALLAAMQKKARPVTPRRLGQIGEEHLLAWLEPHCEKETLKYKVRKDRVGETPFIVEVAFGERHEKGIGRRLAWGLNWTPALKNPFGGVLGDALGEARIGAHDEVVLAVHLAYPRAAFTDRGKTQFDLPGAIRDKLSDCIRLAAKDFTKAKKKRARARRRRAKRHEEVEKRRKRFPDLKTACYHHMEAAYVKASDGGRLPANARQIMYTIRPLVLRDMDGKWYKNSASFTQGALVDFLTDYPELDETWDVVYDARGSFWTPHSEERVPLGTLQVRRYLARWARPEHEFGGVLFIEKEGFEPLLKDTRIAERFDIAVMSTKGQSVTASRQLVDALSGRAIPVFVLHDFDKTGLEIVETLRSGGRRYDYDAAPLVYDLGLRLEDVHTWDLMDSAEEVRYGSKTNPRDSLQACGATEEEQTFLCSDGYRGRWRGRRVELNALTSDQLIEFIETKFEECGVKKVVPERSVLAERYRRGVVSARIEQELSSLRRELKQKYSPDAVELPGDLTGKVHSAIAGTPKRWTHALDALATDADTPTEWD